MREAFTRVLFCGQKFMIWRPSSIPFILYIYGIVFLTTFVISWIKRKD